MTSILTRNLAKITQYTIENLTTPSILQLTDSKASILKILTIPLCQSKDKPFAAFLLHSHRQIQRLVAWVLARVGYTTE